MVYNHAGKERLGLPYMEQCINMLMVYQHLANKFRLEYRFNIKLYMKFLYKQKWLAVFTFILFPAFSAKSQTQLQLILNTEETVDSAFIIHWTDKEAIWLPFKDTLEVNFKTRGIDYYHLNYIMANGKNYFASLILDTGNIKIISHTENEKLIIDDVTGSPMYNKYVQWISGFDKLKLNKDSVGLDSFLLKSYEENIDNLFSFSIGRRYLEIHQNNKLKLYVLRLLLAKQTDELKKYFGFTMLNDRLEGIIKNDTVKLSDYLLINLQNRTTHARAPNAKFVILDFWFTSCLPCVQDHQKMTKLLPLLKEKQTEFISISDDESYTKWKSHLDKYQYKWQHYKKNPGNNNIIKQLGISNYPTYILLDEKGRILHSTYFLDEVLDQLNL